MLNLVSPSLRPPHLSRCVGLRVSRSMGLAIIAVSTIALVSLAPSLLVIAPSVAAPALLSQSMTATEFYQRGNRRYDRNDYTGAIEDYTASIRLNPNADNAYNNRGNARLALKDFRGAITDYDRALRINPKHPLASYNRGVAYAEIGNLQEAMSSYTEAIRNNPRYAQAYNNRGLMRYRTNDFNGALADYNTAIRLNPNYTLAIENRDILLRAMNRTASQPLVRRRPVDPEPTPTPFARRTPITESQPIATGTRPTNPPTSPPVTSPPVTNPPLGTPPPTVATNTPGVNVYKIANATTVLIEGQTTGSGVIISRSGNTYYVLTAGHVVATKDEYNIVTPDGKKYPLDYSQVRKFTNLDLALLQFTSRENLAVARLGSSDRINQGDSIFVSGWPAVGDAITRPTHLVTEGRISGFQRGESAGYELTYSNPTAPGMSGGPVFDAAGQVIGIHGRAAGNTEIGKVGINLGIPIHLFLGQVSQTGLSLQQLGLR